MNPVGLLMRHWYNQNRTVLFLRAVSGHLRSSQTILRYCQLYHILEAYVAASHEIPVDLVDFIYTCRATAFYLLNNL